LSIDIRQSAPAPINPWTDSVDLLCRIDTLDEVEYCRHGGILPYVLRGLLKTA